MLKAAAGPTGPPLGFGRGVNDYLNHYVSVVDAKAAGFLAAAVSVGATVLPLDPQSTLGGVSYWFSLGMLSGSALCAASAILPRLPRPTHQGLIFWEDVRIWPDKNAYQRALTEASAQDIELEYAAQNYVVSGVLHTKHVWVRRSIQLFITGLLAALVAYLTIRYA